MRKKDDKPQPPGGSDMEMSEAFALVLALASLHPMTTDRQCEAIKLIRALAIGSFNMRAT